MARSMAVVNTIANVESIPEKDKIVLYGFAENDWKIIDGKDTYKVGDLVVRIEVDSLLPVREEFEFLRSKCYTPKFDRFRIKAMKMGGVVSQGLLLNLSILPKGKYKSGDDVTEVLDILKMEDAEDASPKSNGTSKLQTPFIKFLMDHKLTRKLGKLLIKFKLRNHISDNFPSSTISKTDETILQNYKGLLTKHAKVGSYVTLKCEGCVTGDTLVNTELGQKTIESLYKEGFTGKVLSFDHETNTEVFKECLNVSKRESTNQTTWYEVVSESGETLKITGEDSLFIVSLGIYRRVDELFKMDNYDSLEIVLC